MVNMVGNVGSKAPVVTVQIRTFLVKEDRNIEFARERERQSQRQSKRQSERDRESNARENRGNVCGKSPVVTDANTNILS